MPLVAATFGVDNSAKHLFKRPVLLDRVVRKRALATALQTAMESLLLPHVERGVSDEAL